MGIETNAYNRAKLNSIHRATGQHIDDKALIIASTPAFQTTFNKFKANIAGVIYAYASANSNETLKQEINLPVTTLMRTCGEALDSHGQNIHDKGITNLATSNNYGIRALQLENLQTAINNYSAEKMKPPTDLNGRKTANANFAVLFNKITTF